MLKPILSALLVVAATSAAANVDTSPRPKLRPDNIGVNNRVSQVDYSKQWNFNYSEFIYTDYTKYQQLNQKYWTGTWEVDRHRQYVEHYNNDNCTDHLLTEKSMNGWQGRANYQSNDKTYQCVRLLTKMARTEFSHWGRGEWNQLLFNTMIPHWLDNNAFVMKNYRDDHGYQENIPFDNLRYDIFYNYYTLAQWYGTDDVTDRRMLTWWENQERSHTHAVWSKNAHKCFKPSKTVDQSEFYPTNRKNQGTGLCQNGAAKYAWMLTLTGLYHKNSDYINEAVWVVDNILTAADKNGATPDAIRGGQAPSYLAKVSDQLDRIAVELDYRFGYDLYGRANKDGTTVADVIQYGINTWMDPKINYDYARKNTMHRRINDIQGQEGCKQEMDQACLSQRSGYISQWVGKLTWNKTQYKKYIRVNGEVEAWDGLRRPIIMQIRENNS